MQHKKEERLVLFKKPVRITKQCYNILRKQKTKQKISMAKIVCNLILKEYE